MPNTPSDRHANTPTNGYQNTSVIGQQIRHFRSEQNLTLEDLGVRVGIAGSQLSLIETGKREPKVSLLSTIAAALGIEPSKLLNSEPPNPRAALELELNRVQQSSQFTRLRLHPIKVARSLNDETLSTIIGLHHELHRLATESVATPEEARRANIQVRERLLSHEHYIAELESLAEEQVAGASERIGAGERIGALTHREVSVMAERLGYQLMHVNDLPGSTRSITDRANGRIYLPPASIPGGHGLRSMALQAMAHLLLNHQPPSSYTEFLWQRLEINYFASACLMPRAASLQFLNRAKDERRLAIEDFRDAFGVTHEAAALRFMNLATEFLNIRLHFLRVAGDGALLKGYANDGLPLPTDITGSVEGQFICKKWSARNAFNQTNRTTENYQYTDTPNGTFWCATQTGYTSTAEYSITVGVPFNQSKWFRGREATTRAISSCPDESCCRRAPNELTTRWADQSWPSARLHAHTLSPLPSGRFPGVDDASVYEFLERHSAS